MKSRIQTVILNAARAALFLVLIFAANSAKAAVPELINFQGKLTDSAGTAITTSVPMVFKFYTTATGGSLVWTENQDVVPDDTGLYSVLLGSATSFSTYGISFSTSYWLGVTVGTDLEMTPRYKIVSSAYALYSINSGTAAYSVNSGTSAWANGVDWPMINHKPVFGAGDVYLASTQTFTGSNIFSGPGTFLSTAAFTAQNPSAPGVTISSGLVVVAGNVGFGTTTPVSTLTVVGTFMLVNGSQAAGNVLTSDANGLASWQTAGSGGDVYLASTQTFTGENTFKAGTFFSSSAYVTGGGIYSTGTIGGAPFSGAGTRFMWIPEKYALRAGAVNGSQWDYSNIGSWSVAFGYNNTASSNYSTVGGGLNNTATGGLYATVGGGNLNVAETGGSTIVGGYNNRISGGIYATVMGGASNTANGNWATVAGGNQNTAKNDNSFAAGYKSSSTANGAFTWSDSEGVVVENDVADRTWFKNRGGFLISNTANAGAASFAMDSSGYVGVGTMLVPSTFTVVGTFKLIDGSAAAGRVLTSDANGLARWAVAGGGGGDVYKASTQTFTGPNTFTSTTAFTALNPSLPGITISSGLVVSAGNVGIGTNAPSSTLTVAGTFQLVDGTQTNGYVLTSNAAGLANWQAPSTGGDVYKASTQTFTGENIFTADTYFSSSVYLTNGGIYSTGTVGGVAFDGAGTRFMWMPEKNSIRAGAVTGSQWNAANIGNNSAAFGYNTSASGEAATVSGGSGNEAVNNYATISGGKDNAVINLYGTIAGGQNNGVIGDYAAISGGAWNEARAQYTTVAGGYQNIAKFQYATISGGNNNKTDGGSGDYATVSGGLANSANNNYATVSGGGSNTASAENATISGGGNNTASGTGSPTVSGGAWNTASGYGAAVTGGLTNVSSGRSAVTSGELNNASGDYSAIAGGSQNAASGMYAVVAGGRLNAATSLDSTVAGGVANTASGWRSTVAGGAGNTALGNYSFAAGNASSSTANGSFTWSDSEGTEVDNTVADRTWFKNLGGFLVTASTNTADGGMFLNNSNYVGIGTLVPTSTLTVVGTFKLVDGTQTNGYVLTSNAAGLASWAASPGDNLGNHRATQDLNMSDFNITNGTQPGNSNFIGTDAGLNATAASDSNFLGYFAGRAAANADNSNFLGWSAGDGAISASNSNFLGWRAGSGASSAGYSNFIGYNAGAGAAGAGRSNFIGSSAGVGANGVMYVNFFGEIAGRNSTNGDYSNFIGAEAGNSATSASYSNFLGYRAGKEATGADHSNFLGEEAGNVATAAAYSNFLGYRAGKNAANARDSIFIGSFAGLSDTVDNVSNYGDTSIAIGRYSGTGGYSNSIAIGHGVINSAAQQLNIGNVIYSTGIYNSDTPSAAPTGGYVGIGTIAPKATLDVNGFMRLQRNSSAPAACDAANDGAIALTDTTKSKICVCDGGSTAWLQITDNLACVW